MTGQGDPDQRLPVDPELHGPYQPRVVERFTAGAQQQLLRGGTPRGQQAGGALLLQPLHGGSGHVRGVVDLSGQQRVEPRRLLVGGDDLQLGDVRGAVPVVGPAPVAGGAAGCERHIGEGAGAYGLAEVLRTVGDDLGAGAGEDGGELEVGRLQHEEDGAFAVGPGGVEVDGGEQDLRGRAGGGVGGTPVAVEDVLRGDRFPVVELRLAQAYAPPGAGGVALPGLREPRADGHVVRVGGEGVVQGLGAGLVDEVRGDMGVEGLLRAARREGGPEPVAASPSFVSPPQPHEQAGCGQPQGASGGQHAPPAGLRAVAGPRLRRLPGMPRHGRSSPGCPRPCCWTGDGSVSWLPDHRSPPPSHPHARGQ